MVVHTCVAECAWNGEYIFHWGHPFLRMYLWWSLCALYLLTRQVELPWAIQVFVVVSLACPVLLFPFVCWLVAMVNNFFFKWQRLYYKLVVDIESNLWTRLLLCCKAETKRTIPEYAEALQAVTSVNWLVLYSQRPVNDVGHIRTKHLS